MFIKKRINSPEDSEDITQEVILKLSNSDLKNVDNVKSWGYTIAKNSITDYYRKKKNNNSHIEEFSIEEELDEQDVTLELSEHIRTFIDQLPEEYRNIMTLSELDNIPQKEIAASLSMNYVTVRSKIQKGRMKLKDLLTDCCTITQGGKGSIIEYKSNHNIKHSIYSDKDKKQC